MHKLFSQRLQEKDTQNHFLKYDSIPSAFIHQFFFIAEDYFSQLPKPIGEDHRYWEELCKIYCLEAGIELIGEYSGKYKYDLLNYVNDPEKDSLAVLDILELAFLEIPYPTNRSLLTKAFTANSMNYFTEAIEGIQLIVIKEDAISRINERFHQHSLGYYLTNKQLIRIGSEILTNEVIIPANELLQDPLFISADQEYQKALRFRRNGDYAECILNANKAFESVLKIICKEMKYYEPGQIKSESAGSYLNLLRINQFYPSYSEDHFKALCNTLEKGLTVLRNNTGSHGTGPDTSKVDDVLADYALHLAATNIVFLVDLFKQKTKQP